MGCGSGPGSPLTPSTPITPLAVSSETPRKPDAVVLDLAPALPRATSRAKAGGVVSLREPLGAAKVTDLVQSFVAAWQHDALDALVALLTPDAGPIEARSRGRAGLVEGWRQRMHAHEYARLAGMELVRPERIQRWDRDELAAAANPKPSQDLLPGEVYVRVPLEVTTVAGEKLFDDVLVMILRPDNGRFLIAAYGEADN
jgi:hypothetical protein